MINLASGRRLLPPLVGLLAIQLILGVAIIPRAVRAVNPDPISAAWAKARAAGSYQFDSNVTQMTVPVAKVTNVGRQSHTEYLRLEGETNLRQNLLELRLWSDGGSVLQDESGVAIKIEEGKSYIRQGAGEWQESDGVLDGLAPQGDFMAYLQAVGEIKANPPERRAGIQFTRYSFTVDGPAFAAYVRDQMEQTLRAKGELPPGVSLEQPQYYRDMTGDGELWVGEDGLPLRQILNLNFPEQREQTVHAQIVVDFSHFGTPDQSLADMARGGDIAGLANALPGYLPDLTPVLMLVTLLACALLIVYYRRTRTLQTALASAVIASMVGGPLLSTFRVDAFYAAQTAKAAAQEEAQTAAETQRGLNSALGAVEFNPNVNPLESTEYGIRNTELGIRNTELGIRNTELGIRNTESGIADFQSPNLSVAQSPNLQTTDPGADTDGDGLTDFAEVRVGTDPSQSDSDSDGLNDSLEVRGFTLGGQTWYLNPRAMDSNDDGIDDGQEWDSNKNNQPDDTDGDGIPDLFDPDNDNDKVPDRLDLSAYGKGTATFSEASPLRLTLTNLAANTPTLVDFQIRPTDINHLWYAYNVLDWPRNDNKGQIQDVDNRTFADLATAQGRSATVNEAYGDLKLVPMLEIRITGTPTNLPLQSDLDPYNISVNRLTEDNSQKLVYIPLSLVTDERTNERVAFAARMRYLPSGSWPSPHDIRLAWVVQALTDIPCDHSDAQDVALGCAEDNYIHNLPQVIQTYYDDFTMTGLNVSEQHGTKTAIVYEDPTADPNRKDDAALATLTVGLDNSFLGARDQDSNGVRDVDINEIARRFNHTTNGAVSPTERWGMENELDILRVERRDYATFDQASMFTAMTDTVKVLNTQFNAAWTADNSIKPTLLFAYEQQARALSLDATQAPAGYVTQSGNAVTLNMQPGGQPKAGLNTLVGIQWTHYCRTGTWAACEAEQYWSELDDRYATSSLLPEDLGDPDVLAGRLFYNHVYDLALMQGIHRSAQIDNVLLSSRYSLDTDEERERDFRAANNGGAALFTIAVDVTLMKAFEFKQLALKTAGKTFEKIQKGVVLKAADFAIDALAGFRANKVRGTGVALTGLMVLGGLGTSAYFGFGEGKTEGKIALKAMIITLQLAFSVAEPLTAAQAWAAQLKAGNTSSVWQAKTELVGTSRTATVIGSVIVISIVWGFFIYSMVQSKVTAFGPEFNRALAETIAATLYIIMLTLLSLTVAGLILVGIVTVIDAILTAVCELGVDDLRNVPGLGGACFTLGTAATKAIAYLLYNYDLMIDTSRTDMVAPGAPKTQLANPSKGFVTGNDLTITMPLTTHVVHKNPDPSAGIIINFYLYLFSKDNLRSSTFNYTLTQPNPQDVAASRGTMTGAWRNVSEDHKYVRTPMYGGYANSAPSINGFNLQPGVNRPASFYLNMGYALPAYECWVIPVVFVYPIPVCYTRTFDGHSSTKIEALHYDIFPATVGGFMALGDKSGPFNTAGRGLGWDAAFPALHDADGDGLISRAFGGLDPNDATWNSDLDNLPDSFELERRALGIAYSLSDCDTDGDGLSDGQEAEIGSNPAIRDTDNDGLDDNLEVWHREYNTSTCQPTNQWSGGWNVTINAASPFTIRVTSDPTRPDADNDGISDLAEKQLAQHADPAKRVDKNNQPYHPNIFNISPITVLTDINDGDRFVALGQNLVYTTTVIGEVALAPSMLDINAPGDLGGARLPVLLTFDAANTAINQTNFTVQGGSNRQQLQLTSTVRARLAPTGPATRVWDAITSQPLAPAITSQPVRSTAAASYLPGQQDSYLFARMSSSLTTRGGVGVLRTNTIPTANENLLLNGVAGGPLMGNNPPDMACNTLGTCLVVWDQIGDAGISTGDRIRYAVIRPDGSTSCCFNITASADAFHPAVDTDGTNFMVTYVSSASSAGTWQTNIVSRGFDSSGIPQSTIRDFYTIEGIQFTNSDIGLDIAWGDGAYLVAFKYNAPKSNPNRIRLQLIGTHGLFAGSANEIATTLADTTAAGTPLLVRNPINGSILLLYRGSGVYVYRIMYSSIVPNRQLAVSEIPLYDNSGNPVTGGNLSATVDPRTNEWLVTVDGRLMLYDTWLWTLLMPTQDLSLGNQVPLACPARASLPVADLRFEEFPGATDFGGAGCSGNSCPAAGLPGATDAQGNAIGGGPLGAASDYSIQFDGVDDLLTMGNPLGNEFTLAFWYKATGGPSSTPFFIESNQPAGFGLFIYNQLATEFFVNNTITGRIATPQGLGDGNWHFVAVTRSGTGALAMYLDGNSTPVTSSTTSPAPTMNGTIRIGGANRPVGLDNLLLYNVALSGATLQNIYNRATPSFCVGSQGNNWYKINTTTPDNRGGKVTASGGLALTVDTDPPTASISGLTDGQYLLDNTVHTIGGEASDPTSGVARVEISINDGPWETVSGSNAWAYNLNVAAISYRIKVRAVDNVGNAGNASPTIVIFPDASAPNLLTINGLPTAARLPTRTPAPGGPPQWVTALGGDAADYGSGLASDAVEVQLQGQAAAVGNGWQKATLNVDDRVWTLNYAFAAGLQDPTGAYTVSVRAVDKLGNQTPDNAVTGILRLDATGPAAALNIVDATRIVISDTLTLSGVITDTGPSGHSAGVDKLEVAFLSVEQIATLPTDISADEADAQLNRTWLPANVAQRGAAVSAWTLQIPAGLEGEYQIDLRGADMLGNILRSDNVWRGVIDTLAPRVVVTGTRGATSWFDPNSGQQMYDLNFTCAVSDRYLNETTFSCPAGGAPVRRFDNNPDLQALFPDRTIVNGLTVTAAYWWTDPNIAITASACDLYGHCASTSQPLPPAVSTSSAAGGIISAAAELVETAPFAVVVAPTAGSYVAADGDLAITFAAEAGAGIQTVTILLDNNVVQTVPFAQSQNAMRVLRTINLAGVSEGTHRLIARATGWANATQSTDYPITFVVDHQPPTVTIDPATLTSADTWAVGSDVLRFNGTAGDSIGLAAVQIREGTGGFVDVQFANGVWQTALPVTDPEGRTLNITVRAIDRAGRVSEVTQTIGTNLSSPTAPDTTITASPANPSNVNSATFEFGGSETAAVFECQLDSGSYSACASPWPLSDLSKGQHSFHVRAIDAAGYVDLSPASFTWTVNASALDATISAGPPQPSSSRTASFSFTGNGAGFECSLDGAAFAACNRGVSYTNLSYGDHSFAVRAVNGGQTGAADRYTWTILNTPPLASDQTLTTLEDETIVVMLTASDEDRLTFSIVTPPTHGVVVGAIPSLSYLPDSGFSGADSFTFRADDGQSQSNLATVTIAVNAKDNTPPTSTITRNPAAAQGQNGWYTAPVRVTVTASDGDDPKASGVAETRCVLDPASPPAAFADLPAGCAYLGAGSEVTADGVHSVYAASRDNRSNTETPVSQSFQIDQTPPTVSVTGVSSGVTYPLGAVPTAGCTTTDATAGVASAATVQVSGGNPHGVGSFTATCGVATDHAGNTSAPVNAAYTVGYDLSRFVMLGQDGVALGLLSEVNSGDVGARASSNGPFLADNAEVSIGQQAKMLDPNSRVLGNRVVVKLQARVYNPSYNHLTNNGQVLGTTATPLNLALLPALPSLPTITPSTQNLSVAQFGNLTINPGSYGTLTVNQYATVTFTGGVYHFQSWSVNQYAKLYFAAPTEIRVAGRVNIVQYSTLSPAPNATNVQPKDIVLYVAGQNGNNGAINATPKAAVFGQGSTIQLNVVAPNGTIQVDQLANVTGALLGRWVSVGQQVKLTLASAFAQTSAANAASTDPAVDEVTEPPAVEPPADEEQEGNDEDETTPPVDPPVEEEPLPSTWTHALFLPLVTATAEGAASAQPLQASLIEEPAPAAAPINDESNQSVTERRIETRLLLPVVSR
jgi:hypothetical protein